MERVEVIGKEGGLFGLIQKVRCSRQAETMGKGQYCGPARTETAAGGKDAQKNLPYSILAGGDGNLPNSGELMVRSRRYSMGGRKEVFYVV